MMFILGYIFFMLFLFCSFNNDISNPTEIILNIDLIKKTYFML